uniref:Rho GTPase activating protein 17b n=1 Tax=Gouania willdenowi TaxID=441366 RepID=A0A8C5DWJ9_GOUWI
RKKMRSVSRQGPSEIEGIERRMEAVRLVSHNTHKKMVACLQGQLGTDTEKRHKKLPLTSLSQAMQEGAGQLGDDSIIGKMMEECGEAESRLATELMHHEMQIERDILEPLNQLAEVEIPNILKQRKQLAKLVLDYDSAKTRWYQATKSSNQAMAAKVDSLKDEMDDALNKVEMCKDQLSADMYNFASMEGEYARYYVLLLEAQADFHRRSLCLLDSCKLIRYLCQSTHGGVSTHSTQAPHLKNNPETPLTPG